MEKKNRISTAYWLLCAVAAVLFGVLSLRTNIWADEAYTFAMVRHRDSAPSSRFFEGETKWQ